MKHLRRDYDRIQDPLGKIGDDEPVFLLRAQDKTAPRAVQVWADAQRDPLLYHAVSRWATHMWEWQRDHAASVKRPDAPAGALRYDQATDQITE